MDELILIRDFEDRFNYKRAKQCPENSSIWRMYTESCDGEISWKNPIDIKELIQGWWDITEIYLPIQGVTITCRDYVIDISSNFNSFRTVSGFNYNKETKKIDIETRWFNTYYDYGRCTRNVSDLRKYNTITHKAFPDAQAVIRNIKDLYQ